MAFNGKVEVTPSQFVTGNADMRSEEEAKKLQKQKWLVLSLTFLVVFAAARRQTSGAVQNPGSGSDFDEHDEAATDGGDFPHDACRAAAECAARCL